MTAWIQKQNNEFADDYTFFAYLGFRQLGYTIKYFSNPNKIFYKKNDVVAGSIESIQTVCKKLKIPLPNVYIPNGLEKYTGREIIQGTVGDALQFYYSGKKYFIKPVQLKSFPAQVINELPLYTFIGSEININELCWISDAVNFISEWRVFIQKKDIVGAKHYWGDYKINPDWSIIESAVKDIIDPFAGYTLDFGITDDSRTLLIESNDGYSIGPYGLDPLDYATLLKNRWEEIVNQ